MDNFVWIFVVIAIISGLGKLFGKMRSDSNQSEMKHPQSFEVNPNQPTSSENPNPRNRYESLNAQTNNGSTAETYETDKNEKPYEKGTEQPYERQTAIPFKRENPKPFSKNRNHKPNPFRHLTKEQLREGIVLAEVLSERPRAKNPHPAAGRYRRMKN